MNKTPDFKKEFTFEIISHYPFPDKENVGSFHAYWEEMDMDLRGIVYVLSKGKEPWINLPSKRGEIDGEPCFFTFYSFADMKKMNRFMRALRMAFNQYWLEHRREEMRLKLKRN